MLMKRSSRVWAKPTTPSAIGSAARRASEAAIIRWNGRGSRVRRGVALEQRDDRAAAGAELVGEAGRDRGGLRVRIGPAARDQGAR